MFDLPDPFGPTTQVIPGSNRSEVAAAKDLNPRRVRLFTYTRGLSFPSAHGPIRPAKTWLADLPHLTASGRRSRRFAHCAAGRGARDGRNRGRARPGGAHGPGAK